MWYPKGGQLLGKAQAASWLSSDRFSARGGMGRFEAEKHVDTEDLFSIDCIKAQSRQTWRVDVGKHEPQLIGQSVHVSNYKPIWP